MRFYGDAATLQLAASLARRLHWRLPSPSSRLIQSSRRTRTGEGKAFKIPNLSTPPGGRTTAECDFPRRFPAVHPGKPSRRLCGRLAHSRLAVEELRSELTCGFTQIFKRRRELIKETNQSRPAAGHEKCTTSGLAERCRRNQNPERTASDGPIFESHAPLPKALGRSRTSNRRLSCVLFGRGNQASEQRKNHRGRFGFYAYTHLDSSTAPESPQTASR